MRGRVEGRGGDARADRRADAGPDESAGDPQAHPVRPGPAGGHDPPDGEATPAGRPGPLHPVRYVWMPGSSPGVLGLVADLAEARSHRLAGRLHDAPGAGGLPPRSGAG